MSANPAIAKVFGYEIEEVLGKNVSMLMPDPHQSNHDVYIGKYLKTGVKQVIGIGREAEGKKKDGTTFPIDLAVAETKTERGHYFTATVRDISERKAAERITLEREITEKANASKSEFLSRMSHEFRTPLNAILGFSQLLEIENLTDVQKDNVRHILQSGNHLLQLINDILEISRVELSTNGMSIEPVQLNSVMREAVALAQSDAMERGITIEVHPGDYTVRADVQRLRQVCNNLLSNAVKYNTPNGTVEVRCFVREDSWVDIEFIDTGMGIPAEKLQYLFLPFERLGAESGSIEGSGLGLALCSSLVESMGGTMSVESELGVGSTFRVSLPEAHADTPTFMTFEQVPRVRIDNSRKARILVIEDNSVNIALLNKVFARESMVDLIVATDGGSGIMMADHHKPDLILLDLHLPDISGREVLRQLKENSELAKIPVIMISADIYSSLRQTLTEEGAMRYLTKPLNITTLINAVNEGLSLNTSRSN